MNSQKNASQQQISDASVIILIWRVVQQMRKRGDALTLDCILNQEKLLHLTLMSLESKTLKAPPFDLTEEVANFIQKINKLTMQSFNKEKEEINSNLFIKAIDLLMVKSLGKYINPIKVLGELKVLTFNNLACIYKKKKKFALALRAVTFALEIEEILIKDSVNQQKHNIITTYLNKAAILSEMGKHQKSVEQINKGVKIIKLIEKQNQQKMQKILTQQEKKNLEERKYYSAYMKMIVYYNLGAQKQHLNMTESALNFYKKGKKIASMIENEFMQNKFDQIILKIST